jgi:hypothetical protein
MPKSSQLNASGSPVNRDEVGMLLRSDRFAVLFSRFALGVGHEGVAVLVHGGDVFVVIDNQQGKFVSFHGN